MHAVALIGLESAIKQHILTINKHYVSRHCLNRIQGDTGPRLFVQYLVLQQQISLWWVGWPRPEARVGRQKVPVELTEAPTFCH